MIAFSQVSKRYKHGHEALRNVSFQIDAGDMVFLTGHSGAGKTTLLKLITGIEHCTSGQVVVNGINTRGLSSTQLPFFRRKVGIIFQNYQLLPNKTVFDNVALPLVVSSHQHHDIKKRVNAALDKVGLLNKAKQHPIMLSGGEQQRVGIARAVVNKPPILLADEPTGNLDPELSQEIFKLFEQFNQVGVCVLIATHDYGLVESMNHRVLTLEQGKLL